jgi:hypothetical protein
MFGITGAICLMGFYASVPMTLAFYDVPAEACGMARRAVADDIKPHATSLCLHNSEAAPQCLTVAFGRRQVSGAS